MTYLLVEQLKHPGKPNPVWRLAAKDYLDILDGLKRSNEEQDCCDSGTFIVSVIRGEALIGRQVIGDRVVLSLREGQDEVQKLGDPELLISHILTNTTSRGPSDSVETLSQSKALLPRASWPNCDCGVSARRFEKWAELPVLELNCYSFAANCMEPTAASGAQPGRKSNGKCDKDWFPEAEDLIEGAVRDGLQCITKIAWPPSGAYHYAALLIDEEERSDFHWLRLERDRFWAHKWPDCPPHFCDDLGEFVKFDPRSRNHHGNGGIPRGDFGRFTFKALFRVPPNLVVC